MVPYATTLTVKVLGPVPEKGIRARSAETGDGRVFGPRPLGWSLRSERTVSDNPDEAALGWTVFGTVSATPFIAKTDRDTLQTIADIDLDIDDLAETDDSGDDGPTTHREERS
ncbi:MAG: hypothetical protein ACOH2Q_04220 [Rhodococcus sp. (in: high G+C Gram-positive bacteria)]